MYQVKSSERFTGIIYGLSGVGKTHLAGTAGLHDDLSNVLVINAEYGLASIDSPNVFAENVNTQADLDRVFYALATKSGDYATIQTVVIDSITVLQKLHLTELAEEAGNPDKIQRQHYGQDTAYLSRMTRQFCQLPINVIFTALVRYQYPPGDDKANKAPAIGAIPDLTEKLSAIISGAVDNVWYMYVEGGTRYLLTQPRGIYTAKTRGINFSKQLGSVVEVYNPLKETDTGHTLASIYDLFQGAK